MISARRIVTKLVLGHNELSDDGCIVLFKFLNSAVGRRYQITEISLNSNSIGDRGLLAIAEYLRNNEVLAELFLQNVGLRFFVYWNEVHLSDAASRRINSRVLHPLYPYSLRL